MKNEEKKNSAVNPKIIADLEALLEHSSPKELRVSLLSLYFELTTSMEDIPIEFKMMSLHIQELINFLEVCEQETTKKKDK